MQVTDITWPAFVGAVGVILCIVVSYSAVMAARKAAREEAERRAAPVAALRQRVDAHDMSISTLQQQVETLQQQNTEQDSFSKLMLRAQLALIRHGVDGNNISGLRDMQGEIQEFLINR